ncbi:hypothetical protein KPH14_009875 [Odynerus spinipes]|uniref:Uncharacterized protein n=1 Tax=Odynerus spinipes TaxID=1348599 RepID=A0AAD9RW97_9HYME|nr:hypothetical protein KPH14_009875 [Odynerus spinipes]
MYTLLGCNLVAKDPTGIKGVCLVVTASVSRQQSIHTHISAMNAIVLLTMLALISPIFCEEAVQAKKHEKRGILGLGYGGYYGGGLGLGLGGLGHGGYVGSPSYPSGHGFAAAPLASHGYGNAPIPLTHGYSAPAYSSSYFGHSGIGIGHGFGHGLGYHGF